MFSQDSLRFVRWRGFQPEVQNLPVEQVMPVKPGHTSKRDLGPHNLPHQSHTCASAPHCLRLDSGAPEPPPRRKRGPLTEKSTFSVYPLPRAPEGGRHVEIFALLC